MTSWMIGDQYQLRILEDPEDMPAAEELQRTVWPGNEVEIVPAHVLLTVAHNGGLVIGAYNLSDRKSASSNESESNELQSHGKLDLIGYVWGFPGLVQGPEGLTLKHCSHQLGVHPNHRNKGIGFALKRAQWQMVRHQKIDRITWTYDPLLSGNAHLNITRLGAVCSTYIRDTYGVLRDGLNVGVASDRFQVDWWVNTQRVAQRLGSKPRKKLDLAHFLSAGAEIFNPTQIEKNELPRIDPVALQKGLDGHSFKDSGNSILLVEIPSEYLVMKEVDMSLALDWRAQTRIIFESLFTAGYIITDFIYLLGQYPRSFYVISHGESTL